MLVSKDRCVNDAYFTPKKTVRDFLTVQDVITTRMKCWEPSCGSGNISTVLTARGYDVISTDLNDYGFGQTGVDFLQTKKENIDVIITNPPYKIAEQFVMHALEQAPCVVMLLRLTFLEGQARGRGMWKQTPLHRVYICSERPSMYKTDHEGTKNGGFVAYAWFVWLQGSEERRVEWIIDVEQEKLYQCKLRISKTQTIRQRWEDKRFPSLEDAVKYYSIKYPLKPFELWCEDELVFSSTTNEAILNGGQHRLF